LFIYSVYVVRSEGVIAMKNPREAKGEWNVAAVSERVREPIHMIIGRARLSLLVTNIVTHSLMVSS
jgi:hypothetical protein